MISFIIIGRNIEKHLQNCLVSVFRFIKTNNLTDTEVLYIDSNSHDESINIAKKFQINIFRITKNYNAASARNLGACQSTKDILFFIDGDMEVIPEFFSYAFRKQKLVHPFITGNFIYKYPDGRTTNYYAKENNNRLPLSNGTFIIERKAWKKAGGMDERFKKAQDFDFILTAAQSGVLLERLNQVIAVHHTVDYNHPSRLWGMLFDQKYIRSLLYRKHIFNKKVWPVIVRREYTSFALILSVLGVLLTACYSTIAIYVIAILLKSIFQKYRPRFEILTRLPYYFCRDIISLLGYLFFWPRKPREAEWKKITDI